ncbi:MAG: IS30 family transposase [Xanthomonadaceae bacterium]|jgi:IS30 family transposase|nr:IS30 family transposase [Xanthomonadaceae bacterium]
MGHGHLNLHERYRIHALYQAGHSQRSIAHALGRATSTVSRELRRNLSGRHYDPDRAQQISAKRRTLASGRCRIDGTRLQQIEAYLQVDWSPEQIAGATGLASHEWIYRHIYADQRQGGMLYTYLRRRRRKRRRRGLRDGRGRLCGRRSWRERPGVVEQRSRLGDWEIDSVQSAKGKAVIVTMTERRSRLHLLAYSADRTAEHVTQAIVRRLGRLRQVVHTMTADNGKEFAQHPIIGLALGADVYFADPGSAWQRGSNENANGLTRQYLPRNMDFSTVSLAYLKWVEHRLNSRPRRILEFKTPLEIFSEEFNLNVAIQS